MATAGGRPYRKVNWPMTTELSTMIAPTDRSMPAVRMTRLCAAPTMPTICTCCRISVMAKGEKNFDPSRIPKIATERQQHDQRHQRRGLVQRVLEPADQPAAGDLEFGDRLRTVDLLRIQSRLPWSADIWSPPGRREVMPVWLASGRRLSCAGGAWGEGPAPSAVMLGQGRRISPSRGPCPPWRSRWSRRRQPACR